MDASQIKELIPLLIPFMLVNYTLVIIAIVDLVKRKKVRFNNKWIWGVIIIGFTILGPVIYFLMRGDEE